MKKSLTLIALACVGTFSFGQSQRLVLVEEFTQASCPPCAAANPPFNALLAANTVKAASVKYQTSWPGVDPMNAQNPSEVATRVTYYGVSGVPDGYQDGSTNMYPGSYTQASIDFEYAVPSPFTLTLTHTMNATLDSVFINCVITCTQNVTMGSAKLRVSMNEKYIAFATPPGSNGEKDFYNIMRDMIPNSTGTTIANTWTVSQTQTLNFPVKIPTYIYNKGEIEIVAWIQDDTGQNVKQAARSNPLPMPTDAGITTITGIPPGSCTTTFTPTVTLKNFGTQTLTSCNINYKIDAAAPTVMPWTGSLATGGTTTVALPAQTATTGGHTFYAYTSSPNGGTDYDNINNQTTQAFNIMSSTSVPIAVVEGFDLATFPPSGWLRDNPAANQTFARTTSTYKNSSPASTKMDFYNNSLTGDIDYLYTPPMNFSTAIAPAAIDFSVAYKRYSAAYSDQLDVQVSTDCGATWTTVYSKAGTVLATVPDGTTAFTPTSGAASTQWRAETINMATYIGQNGVIARFKAINGYGNNLYLDDINIHDATSSIAQISNDGAMSVYPNPFSTNATVEFTLENSADVQVFVYNMVGELVFSVNKGELAAGTHKVNIDGSNLQNGVYFVTLKSGENSVSKKVTFAK